jgi:sugar phosphate isomerase/epimerase
VQFTDIVDVMKDTGFIGLRLTQFPQISKTYDITVAQMQTEAAKRGCQIVTISFNGPTHDPAWRAEVITNAKAAMNFLKDFGANHLVVFFSESQRRHERRQFQGDVRVLQRNRAHSARDGFLRRAAQSHGRSCKIRMKWTAAWR